MQLTLFIPELLYPESQDTLAYAPPTPALAPLAALFGRGRLQVSPPAPSETALVQLLGEIAGCPLAPPGANPPFGPLRHQGEDLPGASDGHWLCADPVHLQFMQERLILADGEQLRLTREEAETLIADINKVFAPDCVLEMASPERWYLRLTTPEADSLGAAPPLSAVAGRRVDAEQTRQSRSRELARLQNELQMFLHDHPINGTRQEKGGLPVNSLWLWGGGTLTPPPGASPPGLHLWSNTPLGRGVARHLGIPTGKPPADFAALSGTDSPGAQEAHEAHHVVVLDQLQVPTHYEDGSAWFAALEALGKAWLGPALAAVAPWPWQSRQGKLTRLRVRSPTVFGCLDLNFSRADARRIWRAPLSPQALAQRLESQPEAS